MPVILTASRFPMDSGAVSSTLGAAAFTPEATGEGTAGAREWNTATLTDGVRRGGEAAVRALHDLYNERLTRYALVITCGDEPAAREAVQSAFLKAIRSLRSMEDESALWAWLARAARTSAADAGRSRRRYAAVLGRFAEFFTGPPETPEDTEAVWHTALESALTELDPGSLALIHARYFHRLPLAETAANHATTDRAIESRLARIREKLRQSILQQLAQRRYEP